MACERGAGGNDAVLLPLLGDLKDVPDAQTSLILNGPPSADLRPVGGDGRRRLPDAHSHSDFRDGLPFVENDPGRREEDVAPDHAPVTASFDLPSA